MDFNILTLGCKVNQYESQAMREDLLRHGFTLSPDKDRADVTVINTTDLASDIEGYAGCTPMKVYIQGGKVLRVEALENEETPKYFDMVEKGLMKKWNGKPVATAEKLKVDAVTGATVSSDAVIENVRRGISYYIYASKKK